MWPDNLPVNLATITRGVPGFIEPNPAAWRGAQAIVSVEAAPYYGTAPTVQPREEMPRRTNSQRRRDAVRSSLPLKVK